jgi:hypothetical protein
MGAPLPDALAYEGSGVTVTLPVRYVAFDTSRPAVSTFAPGEEAKKEDFTFKPGDLRKIAVNPALHGMDSLQGNLLGEDNFQITYSFSRDYRNDVLAVLGRFAGVRVTYGSPRFTFRQLYDFLCARFNGGERFVDTYFQVVFPSSAAGREFKAFDDLVSGELEEEYQARRSAALERKSTLAGLPDMRTREGMRLGEFDAWKKERVKKALHELDRFRRDIRDEIIQCLSTGKIPLNHVNKVETMQVRRDLGLDDQHVFHASGKLIEHIDIDIRMSEDSFGAAL